ncbi:MAG TPA: type II toxin-antitoxin system VapC family toxin [Candidatus Nanoarchaeia archaeon]|nr:type II toxin-antitoxin system VapC family toxin [Candidatus Nanoarchaeia archaeon]
MAKKSIILSNSGVIGEMFTKYGLDTNVLVDLVLYPKAKEYFQKRGYSFPDKFLCTLSQCIGECKGVLINYYGYSEEKADQEIDRILEEFMIEKSPAVVLENDIEIVEEIGKKHSLNDEDAPIIYGFWKLKINIVVVRDAAFENTCKELNLTVIKWPIFN